MKVYIWISIIIFNFNIVFSNEVEEINQFEYFYSLEKVIKSENNKSFQIDYFFLSPACMPCVASEILSGWCKVPSNLNSEISINVYSNDKKFYKQLKETIEKRKYTNYTVVFLDKSQINSFIKGNDNSCIYSNKSSKISYKYKVKKSDENFALCFRDFDSTSIAKSIPKLLETNKSEYIIKTKIPEVDDFKWIITNNTFELYYINEQIGQTYDSNFILINQHNYHIKEKSKLNKEERDELNLLRRCYKLGTDCLCYNIKCYDKEDTVILNEKVSTYTKYSHQLLKLRLIADSDNYEYSEIKEFTNGLRLLHLTDRKSGIWLENPTQYIDGKLYNSPHYFYYSNGEITKIVTDSSLLAPDDDFVSSYNDDLYILLDNGNFYQMKTTGSYKNLFKNIYLPKAYRTFTYYDNEYITINYMLDNEFFLIIYNSAGVRVSEVIALPEYSRAYFDSKSRTINAIYKKEGAWIFEKFEYTF